MTGLPPPPPRPGSPQPSQFTVAKSGKRPEMPSVVHPALASTQDPREPRFQRTSGGSEPRRQPPPSARGPAHSLAGPDAAGAKGTGRSGLPSPPPTWAGSPQSLVAATAPLGYAPPAAPPPGMGGVLKTRVGRGASRSQVVPGVPRGWTEGTRCLGLCTRSTDRASCSRAAADHAWPRQPIG